MARPLHRRTVIRSFFVAALSAPLTTVMKGQIRAASTFADLSFAAQWRAAEAITPNFWGPLATATGAIQEPYKEVSGGQRLVQYFDKGRMELTNGAVTNGLLAKEIISGKVQVGNETYEDRPVPAIPIAGDPDTPGPTYAALAGKATTILNTAPPRIGTPVSSMVAADGTVTAGNAVASAGPTTISTYDDATKHNVPKAFAQYRERAGLAAIGFAISEPFGATVNIGGTPRSVVIQLYERRILTYTEANPDPYKVEMGNIGQYYYRWRYSGGQPVTASPTTSTGASGDTEEMDVLNRINAYRTQNNVPPLTISANLARTAKWMSSDMAAKGYFSHTDSLGRDLTARLAAFGVTGNTSWGENIAGGNAGAGDADQPWPESPDHNENMRRRAFTTIGIGRAQGAAPYHWYWTTDFGNA
jgi:uncharacterized protein YkwD